MELPLPAPASLVAFVALVALWYALNWLLAASSGWRSLAVRFPAEGSPEGERLAWLASGQMGQVHYRNALRISASPRGLELRVLFFFPFNPPLRVPWERCSPMSTREGLFRGSRVMELDGTRFELRGSVADRVEAARLRFAADAPTPDPG